MKNQQKIKTDKGEEGSVDSLGAAPKVVLKSGPRRVTKSTLAQQVLDLLKSRKGTLK